MRLVVKAEFVFPSVPRLVVECGFEGHKIRIIVKPLCVVFAKRFELAIGQKARICFFEQGSFVFKQPSVVGFVANVNGGFQILAVEKAFFKQRLRIDVIVIACKRRGRLIRAVTVRRRIERQYLPTLCACRAQKVYKSLTGRAKRAYSPLARQRTDRRQHSAFMLEAKTVRHHSKLCKRFDIVYARLQNNIINIPQTNRRFKGERAKIASNHI